MATLMAQGHPCDSCSLLRSEGSATVYRLPRSHWHCTLENYRWDAARPAELRHRVDEFVAKAAGGGAPHLLLTGPTGIGKTHLSVAVYRMLVARVGTVAACWLSVPAFWEDVKRGYGQQSEDDAWEDVEGARRLVVLDDLCGRDLTPHERDQLLVRLLDTVYTNAAALLVTMNPTVEHVVRTLLGPHEASRLLAKAAIVPMTSDKDWRL